MGAVHFGSCVGCINGMETFKVRKISWIRPWGALISSFHWCFPRFYTLVIWKMIVFFFLWDIGINRNCLLLEAMARNGGDYASDSTRPPSGYRISTYLWSFQGTFMLGRRLDFIKAYFLPQISILSCFELSAKQTTSCPPHIHRLFFMCTTSLIYVFFLKTMAFNC